MPRIPDDEALSSVLTLTRLDIPQVRRDAVRNTAEHLLALSESLETVVTRETPPSTAFNARWK
ncbi:hypothetical protein [Rhodococcus opacus]|uniref:DUF4089 domain-containing protein n=1 Tax=Rhodococcus opacus TaxID=37919 RepID=A0A2S8J8T9_RHOOP|nr:hypothetical protein [Rhodococcus opacus]PQP23480.1 hypothetical protein C5613_18135 [Rhodococcus opacus]